MKFKLTYYGQANREFDLDVGDMIRWVALDGKIDSGLILGFEMDNYNAGEVDCILLLTRSGVVIKQKRTMFFRLEVENSLRYDKNDLTHFRHS